MAKECMASGKAGVRNAKTRWQGLQNCSAGELLPILRKYSKLEIQPFLAALGGLMTDLWILARRLAATKNTAKMSSQMGEIASTE